MIWGYPYSRKPPYVYIYIFLHVGHLLAPCQLILHNYTYDDFKLGKTNRAISSNKIVKQPSKPNIWNYLDRLKCLPQPDFFSAVLAWFPKRTSFQFYVAISLVALWNLFESPPNPMKKNQPRLNPKSCFRWWVLEVGKKISEVSWLMTLVRSVIGNVCVFSKQHVPKKGR